ncbi:MAG: TraR/DksA C4-type zinc finger protein [Gorillibacterium sp.]|nr:TraR/DksA C4-type zinc finger protein [Gorillibacterium sp.]
MEHLTLEQKNTLHEALLQNKAELDKLLAHTDHFGLLESLSESTGELSTYDNHPADIGSEVFERGKDFALNEHTKIEREQVEAALQRMENASYGTCAHCGEPIPYERLQAVPETAFCIKHTPVQHVSTSRPIEESLMDPPFGRTSFDEKDNETEFDGEDAWQAVSSWGTSESPAMAEDPEVTDYTSLTIESDENVGYVEDLESFLATDLYGNGTFVVPNKAYYAYINRQDSALEAEENETD